MSENNDILEYIVQCLLTNRVNSKKTLKVRKDTRDLTRRKKQRPS